MLPISKNSAMEIALPLLLDLSSILETEQQLLMSPVPEGLDDLLENKKMLLQQLSGIEKDLLRVLESDKVPEEKFDYRDKIENLLKTCRRINEENNALANLGMKNLSQTVATLNTVMQVDDSQLYNDSGRNENKGSRRSLGQA